MVSYPAPSEILPIFNPSVFVTSLPNGGLSQSIADGLYVSLATSQGVPSTKTYSTVQIFNNIAQFATTSAVPGGEAIKVKSNTAPYVARIYNVNGSTSTDLVLPTASGTVALLSDIPSPSTYVTLAGPQTITGIKTFSAAPVISSISNTGVLTLPTSTDTLVGRDTTDTLTNKTLSLVVGAVGAPSLYFSTDNTSGTYRPAANQIGITISGVQRGLWSSTGLAITGGFSITTALILAAGTVGTPSIQMGGDTTSGLYRPAANQVAVSCSGAQVTNTTSTGIAVTGGISTTTTINSAAGTVGNPAVYFSTDTTSGLYRPAANQVAVSCSGVQVTNTTSTGIAVTGAVSATTTINGAAGTVGLPSIYLSTDTTSGLYRPAANQVAVACSGAQVANITSTGLAVTGSVSASTTVLSGAGTVGTPAYQLGGDTTSGIYRPAANQVAVACSGAQVANITSTGLAVTGSVSASTTVLSGAGSVGTPAIQMGGDTTSGLYRSAANEVAVSCSGTQRLKVSATGTNITGISQTTIPMATMMTKSTAQSAANGAATTVVTYNVSSNPSSYFTLDTSLGTITFTVSDAPCMIQVSGTMQFPTSLFSVGNRGLWIEDGSGLRWVDVNQNANQDGADTTKVAIAGMRMITTNATYVLKMKCYQNTGGTINVGGIAATNLTTFCCARIN